MLIKLTAINTSSQVMRQLVNNPAVCTHDQNHFEKTINDRKSVCTRPQYEQQCSRNGLQTVIDVYNKLLVILQISQINLANLSVCLQPV